MFASIHGLVPFYKTRNKMDERKRARLEAAIRNFASGPWDIACIKIEEVKEIAVAVKAELHLEYLESLVKQRRLEAQKNNSNNTIAETENIS